MTGVQITTLTIFRFKGLKNRFFALKSMNDFTPKIKGTQGLSFVKLMGSGSGNGFSVVPDFGQYVLLCVWNSEADADLFFEHSEAFKQYTNHAFANQTIYLVNTMVHGLWNKKVPFQPTESYQPDYQVAVLTRATIKWKDMIRFWKEVPAVSGSLPRSKGPLFAAGIGELPFRYQATFSIWENGADMKAFAYQDKNHHRMVEKTRKVGWYSEELFARFRPYKKTGDEIIGSSLSSGGNP